MSLTKKVAHESDYVSTIVHCCFVLLIVSVNLKPLKKSFRVTLRECMNVIDQEGCS
jgi:hypothetical protein